MITRAVRLVLALALIGAHACSESASPFDVDPPTPVTPPARAQSLVLLVTPKFISDFAAPDADIQRLFDHYAPLISKAKETIVIFSVGNSDHILYYKGRAAWNEQPDWARYTDWKPITERKLSYAQIAGIVSSLHNTAGWLGITLQVFDQIDSGNEFSTNVFKEITHRECWPSDFHSWDIRGTLTRDSATFSSRPQGIAAGTNCGTFLADQVASYTRDLGFDGILYDNQLGTRGRWLPGDGPGYTPAEADAIRAFMAYSKSVLGERQLMWFDSYNNTQVEHDTWSVPSDAYRSFDYLIASGFCVVTNTDRYVDDLESKLKLGGGTKILATLDWVDPWYTYNSMTSYPDESHRLENIAVTHRDRIDGLMFFANDEVGQFVPRDRITAFAQKFFGTP